MPASCSFWSLLRSSFFLSSYCSLSRFRPINQRISSTLLASSCLISTSRLRCFSSSSLKMVIKRVEWLLAASILTLARVLDCNFRLPLILSRQVYSFRLKSRSARRLPISFSSLRISSLTNLLCTLSLSWTASSSFLNLSLPECYLAESRASRERMRLSELAFCLFRFCWRMLCLKSLESCLPVRNSPSWVSLSIFSSLE